MPSVGSYIVVLCCVFPESVSENDMIGERGYWIQRCISALDEIGYRLGWYW